MDKMSLIRTIILVIALVNQVLVASGMSPIPIEDVSIEMAVSTLFTIVVSVWTWWKNNYISKKGQAQKEALKDKDLA